jgi:hypothetical protein
MIYYECYHISKSYNFNMKLNCIFNNMEHQALVTLAIVHVTATPPKWVKNLDHSLNVIYTKYFNIFMFEHLKLLILNIEFKKVLNRILCINMNFLYIPIY